MAASVVVIDDIHRGGVAAGAFLWLLITVWLVS